MNTETSSNYGHDNPRNHWKEHDYLAWAKTPGFNPMKLAAVVAGFAIFPPLGAAALIYFLWKSRRGTGSGRGNTAYATDDSHGHRYHGCGRGRRRWTGNAAFDQHQAEVMQNLRAEREALRAYRMEQRRKRDQEAYEAFRAAEAAKPETPKAE